MNTRPKVVEKKKIGGLFILPNRYHKSNENTDVKSFSKRVSQTVLKKKKLDNLLGKIPLNGTNLKRF